MVLVVIDWWTDDWLMIGDGWGWLMIDDRWLMIDDWWLMNDWWWWMMTVIMVLWWCWSWWWWCWCPWGSSGWGLFRANLQWLASIFHFGIDIKLVSSIVRSDPQTELFFSTCDLQWVKSSKYLPHLQLNNESYSILIITDFWRLMTIIFYFWLIDSNSQEFGFVWVGFPLVPIKIRQVDLNNLSQKKNYWTKINNYNYILK